MVSPIVVGEGGWRLWRDVYILYATRCLRMFSYGGLSIVLFRYLGIVGLSSFESGLLLTCIVTGDIFMSLYLTTRADRVIGRKRTLITGALLKAGAGIGFVASGGWFPGLLISGTLGVISGTGGEIGPFLAVEQSALVEAARGRWETGPMFGYYAAVGYVSQAVGALCAGWLAELLVARGAEEVMAYRIVIILYAALGAAKAILYACLSPAIEAAIPQPIKKVTPLTETGLSFGGASFAAPRIRLTCNERLRAVATMGLETPASQVAVFRLSCLFVVDSFAGGLVMQTYLVAWYARRWGMGDGAIGSLIAAANIVGGLSSALAGHLVTRFGAVNTAVFTHLPSHIFLVAVPLMPSATTAAAMLVLRFVCSQMDVPARQAYVTSVVLPAERSAAGGITNVVRSIGLALAPLLLGVLAASENETFYSAPFFVAGALKAGYDVALYSLGRADAAARAKTVAAVASLAMVGAVEEVKGETNTTEPKVLNNTIEDGDDGNDGDSDDEINESVGLLGLEGNGENIARSAAWEEKIVVDDDANDEEDDLDSSS